MKRIRLLLGLLFVAVLSVLAPAHAADHPAVTQLESLADYSKVTAGQENAPTTATVPDIQRAADHFTHQFNMHRESNKVYEVGILSVLALAILFLALRYLVQQSADPGPHIVNATGLVCIIFGTMLLVLMAQSDQQLTAAMGILGAIAGYLFRSMREEKSSEGGQTPPPR